MLDGPNLYFTRPAVKVSLRLPGYLAEPAPNLSNLARGLGLPRARPSEPDTAGRQLFLTRLVEVVVRSMARELGVTRLGVRVRPARERDQLVVAYPWRHRQLASRFGAAIGPLLAELLPTDDRLEPVRSSAAGVSAALAGVARRLAEGEAGQRPSVLSPRFPVASVTGTNGKTTTTRLLAYMGMTAGLRTGWSSTDGVLVQGELVEPGDYSGAAGARAVLSAPGVQLGVLETARGGLLLKGMGVRVNDVSVVTNVSADHLGLQGIDTIDQLAEVKAIITRVTKPEGWVVLNGDDPRVWAMRTRIRARPWAFSLDPESPVLRESLSAGGRGATVLDGDIVTMSPGSDPDHLVAVLEVPVTLSGLSQHNVANALAATAAALGLGLPRHAVVQALRTFEPDRRHNPGRMNVYTVPLAGGGTCTAIIDLAHNEAGLEALLDVSDGLRQPGALVHLGLGTAGDRTDEVLHGLGEIAGRRADRVQIVHKDRYLRGRTVQDMEAQLREGLSSVGSVPTSSWSTELDGLRGLLAAAQDGDVVALMCHADRPLLEQWLTERGAVADDARAIRRKVVAHRGEHEAEAAIAEMRALETGERVRVARELLAAHPLDPRVEYELASALDGAGQERDAVRAYEQALAHGLREPHRRHAQIGLASSYRNLGRREEARAILADLDQHRPDAAAVAAFRALVDYDEGRYRDAVQILARALIAHTAEADDAAYWPAVTRYLQDLA